MFLNSDRIDTGVAPLHWSICPWRRKKPVRDRESQEKNRKKLNSTLGLCESLETTMSTTKMNATEFQNKVLAELAMIREMLSSAPPSTPSTKEKKVRKPRDPDAAPNPWIVFTGRVRDILKAAGLPAGKECQQFASHLKTTHPNAYSMTDEEIEAARSDWNAPEAKPKPSAASATPAAPAATTADDDVPVAKPKRVLSEEQKAKMAAGRKAAAEKKKAAAAQPVTESSEPPHKPLAAPAPAEKKLRPFPYKGKKLLWDTETNGTWLKNEDGSQGAWFGLLSSDRKTVDTAAANPEA